jgi:hypothetical protein
LIYQSNINISLKSLLLYIAHKSTFNAKLNTLTKYSYSHTHTSFFMNFTDTQFKRGEFYPGVFQFALELSRKKVSKPIPMVSEESGRPSMKLVQHLANLHLNIGTKSSSVVQGLGAVKTIVGKTSSEVQKVIPARVGVLTARAKEFKFALALKPGDRLCSAFRETGRKNGFGSDWGIGSVYYGSAAEWVVTSWKGLRKFENFELMMESDRSVTKGRGDQYILVGDTGEKDEQAGEYIAKKYPDSLRAVFLHVVSENPDVKQVQVPRDRTVGKVPIFYFRTYVGAASKAVRNELMTIDGLKRIIDQAQVDLGVKDEKRFHDLVKTELTEDITEARQLVYSVEQEIMFLKMDKTASTLR